MTKLTEEYYSKGSSIPDYIFCGSRLVLKYLYVLYTFLLY